MKPTAVLVNTARGAVVDEAALAEAVRSGAIAGAHLDVAVQEPLPLDSPLRGIDGIVVYSHLAGQTAEARRAAGLEGATELVDGPAMVSPAPPRERPHPTEMREPMSSEVTSVQHPGPDRDARCRIRGVDGRRAASSSVPT